MHTNQDIASNLDLHSPDLISTSNPSPNIRQSWELTLKCQTKLWPLQQN